MKILWKFYENFMKILWKFYENVMKMLWKCYENVMKMLWKWLTVINIVVYYATELITVIKSFIILAPRLTWSSSSTTPEMKKARAANSPPTAIRWRGFTSKLILETRAALVIIIFGLPLRSVQLRTSPFVDFADQKVKPLVVSSRTSLLSGWLLKVAHKLKWLFRN